MSLTIIKVAIGCEFIAFIAKLQLLPILSGNKEYIQCVVMYVMRMDKNEQWVDRNDDWNVK